MGKVDMQKHCERCLSVIVKTPSESKRYWAQKKYCSVKCAFDRDDYTCILCGKRGGELNADHIESFSLRPDLRLDISNGRTLCVECHRSTDNYGVKAWRLAERLNF